jgi:capsular exopolysaccharide synthesis family protein
MTTSSEALDRPRKKAENIGLKANPPSDTDDGSLDLGALWDTMKRHKWTILLTCIFVTGAVGGYTWTLPKIYEAVSIVAVEAPRANTATMMQLDQAPDLDSEIGILENSAELSRRVYASLNAIADSMGRDAFPLFAPADGEATVDAVTVYDRLRETVFFEEVPEQSLISITAHSESAQEAAIIANVFAEQYRAFNQEIARESVVAARRFLEQQLEKRKVDIQQIEEDWEAFARTNAVATEGQDGQQVAQEYIELQTQRDAIQFQLEQEKRLLAVMETQLEESRPSLRENVLGEQRVQSLRTQIQVLENQIATLKAEAEQFYINDPTLRGNEDRVPELADIKRRIDGFEARKVDLTEDLVAATKEVGLRTGDGSNTLAQMGTQREQIQAQKLAIGQLEAQLRGLDNRIAQYQTRIKSIPRQTVQREQLDRRLAQAEQFYTDIAGELQRTIIAEESELGYVKIMRTAIVPALPVSPNMEQNIALGLLLGLAMGIGGAFVRQSMNFQIYEPDDIQDRGYSLVGVIPKMDREIKKAFKKQETVEVDGRTLSTSLFPLLNPWSPITENYRLIRANLRYASFKDGAERAAPARTMLVTSPEPGDGKTTTAANLAITISLSGHRVLLIDADLRRPHGHQLLGLDRSPGLADLLSKKNLSLEALVQPTVIDNLNVLTAGVPEVPPTELLDSEQMRAVLAAAEAQYDVVIIDTPPVLATTDPIVVAPYCDAVLVVASADKTDFRALSQTESTLGAVGVTIGGVIFNRYDAEKASSSYKYGYGYDYKYDYSPTA